MDIKTFQCPSNSSPSTNITSRFLPQTYTFNYPTNQPNQPSLCLRLSAKISTPRRARRWYVSPLIMRSLEAIRNTLLTHGHRPRTPPSPRSTRPKSPSLAAPTRSLAAPSPTPASLTPNPLPTSSVAVRHVHSFSQPKHTY
jgi:hypothetical protein